MSYRLVGCFVMSVILIFGASCTKLGQPGPGEQKLVLEKLPEAGSIPVKWGKLVSVSSVPPLDNWVQLWFQDDEGTIRIVPYNVTDNYLSSLARTIRRN
jgi:hypothetical protein